MTASSNPQPRPAPEELHWGISYLREDIQDLRSQIGAVHHRIDETNRSLGEQIQDLRNQVGAVHHRIDETNHSLGEQIQAVHHRIDETNRSLGEQIQDLRNQVGAVHHRIDETNKRMDTYFRWTMTTLVAITGILIAVIKL